MGKSFSLLQPEAVPAVERGGTGQVGFITRHAEREFRNKASPRVAGRGEGWRRRGDRAAIVAASSAWWSVRNNFHKKFISTAQNVEYFCFIRYTLPGPVIF